MSLLNAFGFNAFTEALQRRFARFALQKSIGQFLEYKLALDQVNITEGGRFELSELELDAKALDRYFKGTPFEVSYGYVRTITGRIPYARLLLEGCEVSIDGVVLFLRPRAAADQQHVDPASSVMSVFDDMGDVVDEIGEQLAHDMAQESDAAGDSSTPEEGMQSLSYAAKRVMSQVKVEITDVEVRLIAPAKDGSGAGAAPTNGDDEEEEEEAGQQKTVLCIHLQEASIHDTTADTAAISRSSTEGTSSALPRHPPPRRDSRATGESAFDSTTSANSTKEVRFRGYDISLEYGEEDAEGLRIARKVPIIFTGTPDLWDLITIRLHHFGPPDVPKVDANVFVHTFAAALSPELARDLGHLVSCFTGLEGEVTPPPSSKPTDTDSISSGASGSEEKSWKLSATIVRGDVMLAYEDLPLDDSHVLAWLECRKEYQEHFGDSGALEEPLLSSTAMAALKRRHLHLSTAHFRALAACTSAERTVHLRNIVLTECEWDDGTPVLYDILSVVPIPSRSEADQGEGRESVSISFHPALQGAPAAALGPSLLNIAISRRLEVNADISVVDRLHAYLQATQTSARASASSDGAAPTETRDASAEANRPSSGDTSHPLVTLTARQLSLRLPVQLAKVVSKERSETACGWLMRPHFRSTQVLMEMEDARLDVSPGSSAPGREPSASPFLSPALGCRFGFSRGSLGLTGATSIADLVVLHGSDASSAFLRLTMRNAVAAAGELPVIKHPTVLAGNSRGDAQREENLDRAAFLEWLASCYRHSGISLEVACDRLVADLPKAETDLLVQLLLELAELSLWEAPEALQSQPQASAGSTALEKDGERRFNSGSPSLEDSAMSESATDADAGAWDAARRRWHHSEDDDAASSAVTRDTVASLGATSAIAATTVAKQHVPRRHHKATVDVRCREIAVSLHEAAASAGIESTTHFELALSDAVVGVVQGLNGSDERCIALRGREAGLKQRDPTLEMAPPPGLSEVRPLLESDYSLQHAEAAENAGDAWALAVSMLPATEYTLSTINVVMDLRHSCLHYFEDPRGLWLLRTMKLITFPDPPDWPKPQKVAPSIIRLAVHFRACTALFEPLSQPLAAKVALSLAHVSSNIVSGTPVTVFTFDFDDLELLLIDNRKKLKEKPNWHAQGWRSVANAKDMRLGLKLSDQLSETGLIVTLTNRDLELTTCADSFATLLLLADVLVDDKPPGAKSETQAHSRRSDHVSPGTATAARQTEHEHVYAPSSRGGQRPDTASAASPVQQAHTPQDERSDTETLRLTPATLAAHNSLLLAAERSGKPDMRGQDSPIPEESEEGSQAADDEDEFHSADEGEAAGSESGSSGADGGDHGAGLARSMSVPSAVSEGRSCASTGVTAAGAPTPRGPLSPSVSREMSEAMASWQREETPPGSPQAVVAKPLLGNLDLEEDYFEKATSSAPPLRAVWHAAQPVTSKGHTTVAAAAKTARLEAASVEQVTRVDISQQAAVDFANDFTESLAESLKDSSCASPVDSPAGSIKESIYEWSAIEDLEASVYPSAAADHSPEPYPESYTSAGVTSSRNAPEGRPQASSRPRPAEAPTTIFEGHGPVPKSPPPVTQPPLQKAKVSYCNADGSQRLAAVVNRDHFQPPAPGHSDELLPHDFLPAVPLQHVEVKRMALKWRMLAGRDWRIAADDDYPSGEGGPRRMEDCGVTFEVDDLNLVRDTYAKTEAYRSRLLLLVRQFEIFDSIPESYVRVMMSDYETESMPRERNSHMLRVEMMQLAAPRAFGEKQSAMDTLLQIRLLPLRLNLDQDTLNFLVRFLKHEPGVSETGIEADWEDVVYPPPEEVALNRARVEAERLRHLREVAEASERSGAAPDIGALLDAVADGTRGEEEDEEAGGGDEQGHPGDLGLSPAASEGEAASAGGKEELASEEQTAPDDLDSRDGEGSAASGEEADSGGGTFFKLVDVGQIVVRVNYEPKTFSLDTLREEFSFDTLKEQLLGVIKLENAHVILPPVMVKGAHGWPAMGKALFDSWLQTVSHYQVGAIVLTGIPLGSNVANVLQASTGLIHQPVQQYPYVVQGVRDGVFTTVRTTSVEMCNVGTTVLFALQAALELGYNVTSSAARRGQDAPKVFQRSRMAQQPTNVSDGLARGYRTLLDAVHRGYEDVAVLPLRQSGATATGIAQMGTAIPAAGVQALIGMCEAAALTLQGVRNSIHPNSRHELELQYKAKNDA